MPYDRVQNTCTWILTRSVPAGKALGQEGSGWSRDLATLTFDLGCHGACGWCGSSSSIRIPSWKLVRLAVRKIWRTMCVNFNWPGNRGLWPFHLETGMRVASKVGNLPSNLGTLGLWVLELRGGRTDGRKDGQKQRLLPPSLRGEDKKRKWLKFL